MALRAVGSLLSTDTSPVLARLKAWVGRKMGSLGSGQKREKSGPAPVRRAALRNQNVPPIDRLTIAQWLWGEGFDRPGGEAHVLDLVKPFALNPAMSTLDLSAGLGAGTRAIAHTFDTYVTGLERDPALAKRAMETSMHMGMVKRAPVGVYDPEKLELRPHAFDCVLGRQATYTVTDKEHFLRTVLAALKPRGQLLLTDYVADPAAGDRTALALWEGQQRPRPSLWTVRQYTDCLTGLGFDIRITEDITDRQRRLIIGGWDRLLHNVDLKHLPKQHVRAVIDEAEIWVHAMAALESGALKLYRFYALAGRNQPGAGIR